MIDENYKIIDTLEKISIADSFVLPKNKIGDGNGEAKLYVGQSTPKLIDFFGNRGFKINCFLSKDNLLNYLNSAYSEYLEPKQDYIHRNELPNLWHERFSKVNSLESKIEFQAQDQNQLVGPRVYINTSDDAYKLIRELALPIISYINIDKLVNSANNDIVYSFSIFLNGEIGNIESNSGIDNRFIPNSEDVIESELANEEVAIDSPFDPNKIKVRTTPSTIGQIIEDLNDNIINLDTEFQRRPDLWSEEKQSRFIESLLLKLPIPPFYFNEKEENDLEVIDGLQRISTIKRFVIDKEFSLTKLEFLKEFENCNFEKLPSTLSRRIKTFPITNYIIEKGTPDEVKYNIFKRVNTGGLVLTPQEIRHAINQGTPSRLIADLVRGEDDRFTQRKATKEGKAFVRATSRSIGTNRMQDRDFATRFVAFYLISYEFYKPDLDTFLNNGMAKIKELSKVEIDTLREDFYKAMRLAYDIFEDDAFRKRFNKADSRKPINKALFEVLSVNFSKLTEEQGLELRERKQLFINKFIELHIKEDGVFLRAITQGTAQRDSVIKRFTEIEKIVNETLEND